MGNMKEMTRLKIYLEITWIMMMMEMVFMTSMRFITQKIQKIGMISLLVIMMEMVFQMHLKHQEALV